MTTVVYPVRPGDRNEELRYSLRSLVNLPHDRVLLVGHKPRWVTGVDHVPGNPGNSVKHLYGNVSANLRIACRELAGEEFVVMNDDFFILRPAPIPSWHRGRLVDHIANTGGMWRKSLEATLAFFRVRGINDPLSYELHVPVAMDADRLAEVLDLASHLPGAHRAQWRTLYGNHHGIPAERADDVKVRTMSTPWDPDGPFLSTDDRVFARHPSGEVVRAAFIDPSPYEVTQAKEAA